ncbi:hypothetical protein [Pseudomonas sp. WC2]|uniref:hypothetical protein n=1 Tax=Pseudomonas sp. WC2 TaxID=3424773 RepID=UPI003D338D6A
MEDMPDKLRRNVMIISTVILSTWGFDLTLKPSGSILGVVDIPDIPPFKIWSLLTLMLVYFFLRYIYSDQVKDDLKKFKTEYTNLKIEKAAKQIKRRVHRYLKTGKPPHGMPHLIPTEIRKTLFPIDNFLFKPHYFLDQNCSSGQVGITYKITNKRGEIFLSTDKETKYDFEFPCIERCKIKALTFLRASTISKGAVDFLFPMLLATLSIAICLYKILDLIITI